MQKSLSRENAVNILGNLCSPSNCCVSDASSSRDNTCCPLVRQRQSQPAQDCLGQVPMGPLLFPPRAPQTRSHYNPKEQEATDPCHRSSTSSVASTTAGSEQQEITSNQENEWQDEQWWRRNSQQQRVRAAVERDSIRRLVNAGIQHAVEVDLRTGQRSPASYWVREDARVLCLLQDSCSKVAVLPCGSMEVVTRADESNDVTARRFFLGLSEDELRRAVLIVMFASHGCAMPTPLLHHHAPLPPTRVRCMLICVDRTRRRLLLDGLKNLQAERLLLSPRSQGPDATTRGFDEDSQPDLETIPFTSVLSTGHSKRELGEDNEHFQQYLQHLAARIEEINCDRLGLAGSDDSVTDSGPSGDQESPIQPPHQLQLQDNTETKSI